MPTKSLPAAMPQTGPKRVKSRIGFTPETMPAFQFIKRVTGIDIPADLSRGLTSKDTQGVTKYAQEEAKQVKFLSYYLKQVDKVLGSALKKEELLNDISTKGMTVAQAIQKQLGQNAVMQAQGMFDLKEMDTQIKQKLGLMRAQHQESMTTATASFEQELKAISAQGNAQRGVNALMFQDQLNQSLTGINQAPALAFERKEQNAREYAEMTGNAYKPARRPGFLAMLAGKYRGR